jgi:hypothetical protein
MTAFVLWVALGQLAVAVDLALQPTYDGEQPIRAIADEQGGPLQQLPAQTRTQPLAWWDLTQQAAGRMAEAMRTGQCWNPRTPAEEAVVHVAVNSLAQRGGQHVAVTCGYTDVAFDLIGVDDDLRAALDALPVASTQPDAPIEGPEADYTFDELLPALTGDADIEILWDPGLDGLDDPAGPHQPVPRHGRLPAPPLARHLRPLPRRTRPPFHTVVTQPTPPPQP